MKLLSIAVPCFNSQDYMEHCISTLLAGGEDVEILIVNDGSKDATAEIANRLQSEHPGIIRAIHQENAGHGGAVATGILNATGLYFKVVDSDDWVDETALLKILALLREFSEMERPVDLLVSNYIYDKPSENKQRVIRYRDALPRNKVLSWNDVGKLKPWETILMHAIIYRTEMLRASGLKLPKHTFYVDNLYATVPLASVASLYYLDVDLYHYFIGREGQSVQTETMIRRIDQQILVNHMALEQVDVEHIANAHQQETLLHYHEVLTAVTDIMLTLGGTKEHDEKRRALWDWIKTTRPWEYKKLRHSFFGRLTHVPSRGAKAAAYRIANRIFSFN